uniref:Uncharacterized protein n=1 Tax=Nephromyces sp. ex Molgula occidentalis TaxID=2544991 RepID=A0A5C1H7F2_9APIC|nr:hypothetical protein [Nephromyces sp. ex Molgula occidentalis]
MISFVNMNSKKSKHKYLKSGYLSYINRKYKNRKKINIKNLNLVNINYSNFKNLIYNLNIYLNINYQYLLLKPFIFNYLNNLKKISNNKIILLKLFINLDY